MGENNIYRDHDNVTFLTGKYNIKLLRFEDFLYKRTNGNFPRTSWKCISYSTGCTAVVITYNGKFESSSDSQMHNHRAPIDEIKVITTKMTIKHRVKTEFNLSPRQIHRQERTKLLLQNDESAHMLMDSYSSCKASLYRYRQAKFPSTPKTRADILLEDEWTRTLDGKEQFVLINDGVADRIIVFGTESNLNLLCSAEYVVSDGTFKVHPSIFAQLYVFHAPYLSKVLPLIFCLLPDKSYNTYTRLLCLLKERAESIGTTFSPPKIHIDYEMSMINAISQIFSQSVIQGCFFHFSQCIWRKVQDLGMTRAYENDQNVRRWIRRCSVLPFLPLQDIDDGFIEICENAPEPGQDTVTSDQIEKFHDYMVDTWVNDLSSRFSRELWNQYTNDGPRTTNNAEGWNCKLNNDAKTRLSFFQFVYFMQCMQVDLNVTKFDLISASPSVQSNRVRNTNKSLSIAKQNYKLGKVQILHYLDSISMAVKLD